MRMLAGRLVSSDCFAASLSGGFGTRSNGDFGIVRTTIGVLSQDGREHSRRQQRQE